MHQKVIEDLSPWQKHRNFLMINQIAEVFGDIPLDLEDFVTASQVVQAEAMKFFIEFWRMDKGNRNGILWWNLRDGWPIISDAVVDYYGGKKLAYQYIKNVQTDVCVMVGDAVPEGHEYTVNGKKFRNYYLCHKLPVPFQQYKNGCRY